MRRLLATLVAAVPALAACGGLGLPEPATRQAAELAATWRIFFWAGVAVAAVVLGLIAYVSLRGTRREREPATFRDNLPVEVVYTVVPVLIVVVLFAMTALVLRRVNARTDDPSVRVEVLAFDWSWRFTYPEHGIVIEGTPDRPPQLVLPAGEPVAIELRSADVVHAFFVPEFLFKRDAVPGRATSFDLEIERPGTYGGHCAEFCGLDHARMRFTIRALAPTAFDAWVAEERS